MIVLVVRSRALHHHWRMAITSESIDRALYDLGNLHAGPELAFESDPTNLEMARLLAVVDTVNGGEEHPIDATWTQTDWPVFGVTGGKAKSIIEKLSGLIAKIRSALAELIQKITGAMSFSIGFTGPVLSVSVTFNS